MKKTLILLAIASLSFTSCSSNDKAPEMLNNEIQKKEIFSAIISNDKLLSEFMDTMMTNHHDKMMSMMESKMKSDKTMQMDMMGGMMNMCEKDSLMCNKMMTMMQSKPMMMNKMKKMNGMKM